MSLSPDQMPVESVELQPAIDTGKVGADGFG